MTFDRPSEEPFETNCDIRRGRKCQSSWSFFGPDLAYWRYFVIIDENFIFHNGRTVTTTRLCFDRWDLVCSLIEHKQQYQTQVHRMMMSYNPVRTKGIENNAYLRRLSLIDLNRWVSTWLLSAACFGNWFSSGFVSKHYNFHLRYEKVRTDLVQCAVFTCFT